MDWTRGRGVMIAASMASAASVSQAHPLVEVAILMGDETILGGYDPALFPSGVPGWRPGMRSAVEYTYRLDGVVDPDGPGPLEPHDIGLPGTGWGPEMGFPVRYESTFSTNHDLMLIKLAWSRETIGDNRMLDVAPALWAEAAPFVSQVLDDRRAIDPEVPVVVRFFGFAERLRPGDDVTGSLGAIGTFWDQVRTDVNNPNLSFITPYPHLGASGVSGLQAEYDAFAAYAEVDEFFLPFEVSDLVLGAGNAYTFESAVELGLRVGETAPTPGVAGLLGCAALCSFRRRRSAVGEDA